MADRHLVDQHQNTEPQMNSPASRDDMTAYVIALETALLLCLPARELQARDPAACPYHQIDVERHIRDFMEVAEKLQFHLIGLRREELFTRPEILRKEIENMEEELETKTKLIAKQERLIQGWRKELKDQLNKHIIELERV
ncbi:Mediator of RNA polymerase II transcription subunit 28 [Capsicum baccatum]|uniref:Mediator of RNA polymerase II transcription subunit 28 n=1 Tax=Capsicum baccatum TaxID=33114 RepID=A0A2G2W410_CAPBA|nr:Mediator of RNA polymerase II transcription subunit 28 [Capsicum baccatum]